jgi:hypothetical protein
VEHAVHLADELVPGAVLAVSSMASQGRELDLAIAYRLELVEHTGNVPSPGRRFRVV